MATTSTKGGEPEKHQDTTDKRKARRGIGDSRDHSADDWGVVSNNAFGR